MERQELIEGGVYPHSWKGNLLSLGLVVASIASVPILVNNLTSRLLAELLVGIIVVYALTAIVRVNGFRTIKQKIIASKTYSTPPPKRRMKATILFAGLLFIVIPYFAVSLVDPVTWLIALGGVICGLNLGELTLSLYVGQWAAKNQVRLTRFEIWLMNDYMQGRLSETGIRAEKTEKEA